MLYRTDFSVDTRSFLLNLDGFKARTEPSSDGRGHHSYVQVPAIWARHLSGGLRLYYGRLWSSLLTDSAPTAEDFLVAYSGTYGGVPYASWDGLILRHQLPEAQMSDEELVAHLRPIWMHHPRVPAGYSGWWTLRR